MVKVRLGKTEIVVPQNGFGALPIQRVSQEYAVKLLRRAYEGGMRFFDTARAYSNSEVKVGEAFDGMREKVYIATKTAAKNPEDFWSQLETSLTNLRTDYIDIYQLHCVDQCYKPGDGTGMYEALAEAKKQGKIRHIGITTHKLGVANEIIECGLYETLQYPISYLSTQKEIDLIRKCVDADMGFIGMKGLAGGLITRSEAAMAFADQFENFVPIWGVQKENELEEWLSYMDETPAMNEEISAFIEKEKAELDGEFCRGCGYCVPTCPAKILINNCARMSLMLRRAPSRAWLYENMQAEMKKIEDCINCRVCTTKCPYELNTPELLKKNYEDYKRVLAGEVKVLSDFE